MEKINGVLLSLGSVCIVVSYIPQIIQTYKIKDVSGQSLMFWGLLLFSIFTFVNNGIVVYRSGGGLGTLIPQLFNFIFAGAMFIMVLVYREESK